MRKRIPIIFFLIVFMAIYVAFPLLFHEPNINYSIDVTGIEAISVNGEVAGQIEAPFVSGGKTYVPFTHMNSKRFGFFMNHLELDESANLGQVVAYRNIEEGHSRYYYSTIDALCGDWLLMFEEDGTGGPNDTNVVYLYCTKESAVSTPEWLKAF